MTPEDGIGQSDVDAAYEEGAASVDITSDNDAAYDEGVASVMVGDANGDGALDVLDMVMFIEQIVDGGTSKRKR